MPTSLKTTSEISQIPPLSTQPTNAGPAQSIKALDTTSVHRIASGQVVIDLQTAVKELVENSLDAKATSIEVRFKEYGLAAIEVVDNGSGIAPGDYDSIGLKHHTSKLSSFSDLTSVRTFGFRGEALSSLCALAEQVTVTTATAQCTPMGTVLELDRFGRVARRDGKVARQRGTTICIIGLFKPLPVRRKELERNAKREFGKALTLLSAYALVPCAQENHGVRLTVTHQTGNGKKSVQMRTDGAPSMRASVSALWGPKALEHLVELDFNFDVETERAVLRRRGVIDADGQVLKLLTWLDRCMLTSERVGVQGVEHGPCARADISVFGGFFFVNGRPCNPSKVQKAFNEVYRTFNATQSPFIVANFNLPTESCDVNVSPDKRTILLHSENNLVQALKAALEQKFAPSRATYDVSAASASQAVHSQPTRMAGVSVKAQALFIDEDEDEDEDDEPGSMAPLPMASEDTTACGSEQFGDPVLLLGDDEGAPEGGEGRPRAAEAQEAAGLRVGDAACQKTPGDGTPAGSSMETEADHSPGASIVAAGSEAPPGTASPLLTVTQLQTAIAQSGSPSASQSQLPPDLDKVGDALQPPRHAALYPDTSTASGENTSVAADEREAVDHPMAAPPRPHRETSADASTRTDSRRVQMVISTAGAAWNLRRPAEDQIGPVNSKRRKVSGGSGSDDPREGKGARQDLRAKLRAFASAGSQAADAEEDGGADRDEEDELDAGEDCKLLEDEPMDAGDLSPEPEPNVNGAAGMDLDSEEVGEFVLTGTPILSEPSQPDIIDLTDLADNTDYSSDVEDIKRFSTQSGHPRPRSESSTTVSRRPEIVRTAENEDVPLRVDFSRISSAWTSLRDVGSQSSPAAAVAERVCSQSVAATIEKTKADAGVTRAADDSAVAEALARVIDKTDFAVMDIVGQFNLGFIVVRRQRRTDADDSTRQNGLDKIDDDDLFIVDQHAADEKYNFETLQQTTVIKSQRLFRPLPLELTAADELLARENVNVLKQNGFEVELSPDDGCGGARRLQLIAQPTSKETVFDVKDLEELLHLLQDRSPGGQPVRCSKARAMFAMHGISDPSYGHYGPAMALPARAAHDAPPIGCAGARQGPTRTLHTGYQLGRVYGVN
ncbi:uncharacterized protein FIBRA_06315 [Fibroporia radiculosa]|uniref:DNA mismatch repair protein S5 domain-containing protein n=1 Tax=Fibroporia radiculosa TaxID=599839 RepID=J4GB45_9APHY|nr:uncharacterized protein FIBRA_06315 [Fibroporia radiculosa]CCM04153.1 predicted protein [Fibroporia radiculosa]